MVLWIPALSTSFRLPGFHCLRRSFPEASAWMFSISAGPQPRTSEDVRFGRLPRSLAATWGISFDYFSSGYLDVSVRRVCLPFGYWNLTSSGLPHSGTRGSGLTCSSPRLFAAYRAFRRLGTPRHPPYALGSLTFSGYLRKPQSPARTHLHCPLVVIKSSA